MFFFFAFKLENWTGNFETNRDRWLKELESLVETISRNFAHFLQCLQCAGEVDLDKGEDGVRKKVFHKTIQTLETFNKKKL